MELFLNLAWAFLALVTVPLWLRFDQREKSERRLPFIALAMLIVMLFPVISVSDDLWSMQNPAEADSCVRRDQSATATHIFPSSPALPEPAFTGLRIPSSCSVEVFSFVSLPVDLSAVDRIQSRPPPAS